MVSEDTLELSQKLSAMFIQWNTLQALAEDVERSPSVQMPAIRQGLAVLGQMIRELLYEVRAADDEIPFLENGIPLGEALSRLVEETAELGGFSSRVSFSGEEHALLPAAERLLYLIAQEVLYQVQQHVGIRRLRLTFAYGQDAAQVSIEDDGTLPPAAEDAPFHLFASENDSLGPLDDAPLPLFATQNSPSLLVHTLSPFNSGIFSDLQRRLEHLGGSLEVHVLAGQGMRVQARVPYEMAHSPSTHYASPPSSPHTPPNVGAQFIGPPPPSPAIRILVVDNQAVTRAGLSHLLTSYIDLQVVGEAADGVQAVSETLELGPQVVLMDMQLPNGQSLEALRQIKQLNLDTRVLLLSAHAREEYLYEALRMGADGYVLKDIAPDELAQAVRAIARGEVLVRAPGRGSSTGAAGRLVSRFGSETLTAREREVLHLLARGLRNKEMAARLYVSERTVNFHLANIYQKLNVSGRTEALSKALEQGLLTL